MKTNSIDLTGLNPQQINKIREMVQEFRNISSQSQEEMTSGYQFSDDEELEKLHNEFDWLVANLGVKTSLTWRGNGLQGDRLVNDCLLEGIYEHGAFPKIYRWGSRSCSRERTLQDRRSH